MQKRFGTFEKWSPGRGYCGVHGLGKDTLYLTITILYLFHFLPLWTIPFWHWNMPDKTIWKRILDHCKTKETCPQISQSRKMFFFQLRWWDFLFFVRQLKCCGVSGPSDWKNSSWYKNSDRSEPYPESCCKNPTAKCSVSPKKEDIYQDVSMAIISSGAGWNGDPWKLLARSTLLQNIGMIS